MKRVYVFFRDLIQGLRLPSYYVLHQEARKTAFLLLGALIGLITGVGMAFSGYALLPIVLGSLTTFLTSIASTYLLFTDYRQKIAKIIDDYRDPPIPVTIPAPEDSPEKIAECTQIIDTLMKAKNDNANVGESLNSVNIATIKTELKKLFNLRSYNSLSETDFNAQWKAFHDNYEEFQKKIPSENDWSKPEILNECRALAIEAVILSDTLCARLEQSLRNNNKEVTTQNISATLIDQTHEYCRRFIYGAIIDLYHFTRGKMRIEDSCAYHPSTDTRFTEFIKTTQFKMMSEKLQYLY